MRRLRTIAEEDLDDAVEEILDSWQCLGPPPDWDSIVRAEFYRLGHRLGHDTFIDVCETHKLITVDARDESVEKKSALREFMNTKVGGADRRAPTAFPCLSGYRVKAILQ
jgi:hypothetical protein